MSNTNLGGIALAAALAEEIYRRADSDSPIDIKIDLEVDAINVNEYLPVGHDLNLSREVTVNADNSYYYTERGFVGRVVQKDGIVYVVFRGTDEASGFASGFSKMVSAGGLSDSTVNDSSYTSDLGDWSTNAKLGQGTMDDTQLDDALALTRAAKEYAAINGLSVQVVGQSLGGGLTGLVSAIEDVVGWAIAPAPFDNQLNMYASISALAIYGVTKDTIKTWTYGQIAPEAPSVALDMKAAFKSGGYLLKAALRYNLPELTEVEIQEIADDRDIILNQLQDNIKQNLHNHTITGEVLSDGLGSLVEYLGTTGSTRFQTDTSKTVQYDLGVDASFFNNIDLTVSLHGSALHNLVIRTDNLIRYEDTEGKFQRFSELFVNSEPLRDALLIQVAISGPDGGDRKDPHGNEYGGSGVLSSKAGADPSILFRTLWKTVGVKDGFYDKFYTVFSQHLTSEAIQQAELRKGLTFLGLQVIRDGLRDPNGNANLSDQAAKPFEIDGLRNGIAVDINLINDSIVDGSVSDSIYGYTETNAGLLSTLMNFLSVNQLNIKGFKLNLDLTSWRTFVHGNQTENMIYITDDNRKNISHAIIGGEGNDLIAGSDAKDIIIASKGNNRIAAGNGDDFIIGGTGDDIIYGEDGDDTIIGGIGYNQFINGGKGNDYLVAVGAGKYYGAEGDDFFIAKQFYSSSGIRYMDGGSGYDIAYLDNLLLLNIREMTIDGVNKYGFHQGPSEPWQIELFKYGATHFTNIEEFRVGWSFDYATATWTSGNNSLTYSKDDLYNYLLTGENTVAENFENATFAVVSAANFAQPGKIVIFKGTIIGEANNYEMSSDGSSFVEIGGVVLPVMAHINGRSITFYIEIDSEMNFTDDVRISGTVKLKREYIDPEDGSSSFAWDGSAYRFDSVVSTSLEANHQTIPINNIAASGLLNLNNTFTGIIFNVEKYGYNDSILWSVESSDDNDFYIFPNGELHSLEPITFSNGAMIKLSVTATSGTEKFTKNFILNGSGSINNFIEGTVAGDRIYDTEGDDTVVSGSGNDVIVTSFGHDTVLAGDGDDTLLISTFGTYYGDDGNDVFDISNVPNNDKEYMRGSINGGNGYDLLYANGLEEFTFALSQYGRIISANGFHINEIDEFRLGFEYDNESAIWHHNSSSTVLTFEQFEDLSLQGVIHGINFQWKNISTYKTFEQIPYNTNPVKVFSGELKASYTNISIVSVEFWINGASYNAWATINGDVVDIYTDAYNLISTPYETYYIGNLILNYNDSSISVEFGGKVMDQYNRVTHTEGTNDNDVFDIGDPTFDLAIGSIDGKDGYDIVYLSDNSVVQFITALHSYPYGVALLVDNFEISNIEEIRSGWRKDANGIWHETENSKAMTFSDIVESALSGEIVGLNKGWENITVSTVDESLSHSSEYVVIFQGELSSPLPTQISLGDTLVNINGINWQAEVSVDNGVYTIKLPKSAIVDVDKNSVFSGRIYSKDSNGVLTQFMGFNGLIKNVYDLQNAPTQIIGTSTIDPTGVDVFDPIQFEVDHFNVDKPITWTVSGSGSEFFTISNEGILSSTASTDFSVSYELTIEATDGVKSVVKSIYINPYNPINVIFGTNADDIINGTAKDDIIHGLEGDDTIYVGGGFDTVYGGAGNDIIIASDNYVDLYGEDGNDTLIGSVQDDYLYGGDGDDIIYGGGHKDRIWGGEGADTFVYKNITDSDYENLDLSDRIFDLEDIDSFDFTEMGEISFDWDNGPAGSLYVEVNWQPDRNYGYLSIDVDRDGVFDMAIDFDVGASGLSQINFVNGPTYYLDSGFTASSIDSDELLVKPITDNAPDAHNEYQWAA